MAHRSGDQKMKITQNVIMDLLPVYHSGEASPDTRNLIEEFLRQNPGFSSVVESQKRQMALALMLTGFPFSFFVSSGHLTFIIVRDQPMLAVAAWFGAAILWILYFLTRRRL